MQDVARSTSPDAILTIGPWLDVEYRSLFRLGSAVHLLEEDISPRRWEGARPPLRVRLQHRLGDVARRRDGMTPSIVVVISEPELRGAHTRFKRSRVSLIRYTLDPESWPPAESVSQGENTLVVGNLAEPRNAQGLLDVLREIRDRGLGDEMPVRLVSAPGLHPMLTEVSSLSWIETAPFALDISGEYRRAKAVLVPARSATGFKTTILQAWTCGTPVVCFPASAATLGANRAAATLVGQTPRAVVDHLVSRHRDERQRIRLARMGMEVARRDFSHDDQVEQLRRLLERVQG